MKVVKHETLMHRVTVMSAPEGHPLESLILCDACNGDPVEYEGQYYQTEWLEESVNEWYEDRCYTCDHCPQEYEEAAQ